MSDGKVLSNKDDAKYESSNVSVTNVDNNGLVSAVGQGRGDITVLPILLCLS
jgi:uncharacterized protein YjdB